MSRQTSGLVVIGDGSYNLLKPISLKSGRSESGYDEDWIQSVIFEQPECLPVADIAPSFGPMIPVCRELATSAGPADVLFVNPLGMPTLVECKLWRNPSARREVVGQIIDYARVLRHWTYVDMQREAARARKEQGFNLAGYIGRLSGNPDFSEAVFCDNLARNLSRGHILLLIVGDGIRAGVEAIAEYIQDTAALHFILGLIEATVYRLDEGHFIVHPQVLAKTAIINRSVIDGPVSSTVVPSIDDGGSSGADLPQTERQIWMRQFWSELLASLRLDDADQPLAEVRSDSAIYFRLPSAKKLWVTCYFYVNTNSIGVFLGMYKNVPKAMAVGDALERDAISIREEFETAGVEVATERRSDGKFTVISTKSYPTLRDDSVRNDQLDWFRKTINVFINVLRPKIQELWRNEAE